MISAILKRSAPTSIILYNPKYKHFRIEMKENQLKELKSRSTHDNLEVLKRKLTGHLEAHRELLECWHMKYLCRSIAPQENQHKIYTMPSTSLTAKI